MHKKDVEMQRKVSAIIKIKGTTWMAIAKDMGISNQYLRNVANGLKPNQDKRNELARRLGYQNWSELSKERIIL
ncbi:MAG: hypothetical protein ACPKOI_05670 [Pleomorphochaeta sp.]